MIYYFFKKSIFERWIHQIAKKNCVCKLWNSFRIIFLNVKIVKTLSISASPVYNISVCEGQALNQWMPLIVGSSGSTALKTGTLAEIAVFEHSSLCHPQTQVKTLPSKWGQNMWTWSRKSAVFSELKLIENGLEVKKLFCGRTNQDLNRHMLRSRWHLS